MPLDAPWLWLSTVLAGWVFVGLLAGRFSAFRAHLNDPRRHGPRQQ